MTGKALDNTMVTRVIGTPTNVFSISPPKLEVDDDALSDEDPSPPKATSPEFSVLGNAVGRSKYGGSSSSLDLLRVKTDGDNDARFLALLLT
jgi:hypothetical protein